MNIMIYLSKNTRPWTGVFSLTIFSLRILNVSVPFTVDWQFTVQR